MWERLDFFLQIPVQSKFNKFNKRRFILLEGLTSIYSCQNNMMKTRPWLSRWIPGRTQSTPIISWSVSCFFPRTERQGRHSSSTSGTCKFKRPIAVNPWPRIRSKTLLACYTYNKDAHDHTEKRRGTPPTAVEVNLLVCVIFFCFFSFLTHHLRQSSIRTLAQAWQWWARSLFLSMQTKDGLFAYTVVLRQRLFSQLHISRGLRRNLWLGWVVGSSTGVSITINKATHRIFTRRFWRHENITVYTSNNYIKSTFFTFLHAL